MNLVEEFIPDCMSYKKLENQIKKHKNEKTSIHQ